MKLDDVVLPQNDVLVFSKMRHIFENSVEKIDDHLYIGGLGDNFLWECPETLPDRLTQTNLAAKRKLPSMDGPVRRARGESFQAEISTQNAFSRGLAQSTVSSGPTRRDAFRQRKPNTSRPPSMHVDDYVARERNVEGVTNVIAVPRTGSTGGRPPSIHVDEFMARQRERQNPSATVVGEAVGHLKNASSVKATDAEKLNKSKQLKTDLDDDLHGIDIVFDGEESDSDDKLPFPQPDDNLQQPAPVILEQSSPRSIVEETESDVVDSSQFSQMGTPLGSNIDENAQGEFSSKMSGSRPDMSLTRESSVSSDRKYVEHADDSKNVVHAKISGGYDSATANSSFPVNFYNNPSATSMQLPVDSRMASSNFFLKNSPQHGGIATGSQGLYDQRFLVNQPPLPPMPPPPTVLPVMSHATDSVPSQSPSFVNSPAGAQRPVAFQVRNFAFLFFSYFLLLWLLFQSYESSFSFTFFDLLNSAPTTFIIFLCRFSRIIHLHSAMVQPHLFLCQIQNIPGLLYLPLVDLIDLLLPFLLHYLLLHLVHIICHLLKLLSPSLLHIIRRVLGPVNFPRPPLHLQDPDCHPIL